MTMRMGALYQALLSAGASEVLAREAAEEAAALHLVQLRIDGARQGSAPSAAWRFGILEILVAVNVIGHVIAMALIWLVLLR